MDIICPRCGEPWDTDSLHDSFVPGRTFDQARKLFFTKGCGIALDDVQCAARATESGELSAALFELYGDDVDGIAADLEDFGLAGGW